MGYTHYWRIPSDLDKASFALFANASTRIITEVGKQGIGIDNASGDNTVFFNGVGEESHESFCIRRKKNENFDFTKTARKPYDLAVTSCLIAFKHFFEDKAEITSDGDDTDWLPAKELCQKLLGFGKNFKMNEELIETEVENGMKKYTFSYTIMAEDEFAAISEFEELIFELRGDDPMNHFSCEPKVELASSVSEQSKLFPITSIARADLEEAGFKTENVTDETMKQLADKLASDYCQQLFWDSLKIIATNLGIPK